MVESPENYNAYILYLYAISHLPIKDKVRFYYGLKGRDGKSGIVKEQGIQRLARGALLVQKSKALAVEAFLEEWQCSYEKRDVLIPK